MAMPTYEYVCVSCETRVETVQSFTEDPLETCEECGGRLRKIIFPVGIQFKGSGFYSNDRKASQPTSRVKDKDRAKDGADSAKGSGEGAGSDDKPKAKPSQSDSGSGFGSGSGSDSGPDKAAKTKSQKVPEKTGK